ncbi:MAG: beta-N-acetylhexosaminidase [Butyrivibrio sp.]|nr:beta-N-acetylhexosaminidase [Butyrivibrio sp.]
MARLEEQDFDEKRLARRQRRKQSQLIAYITLVVALLVIVVGVAAGIHFLRAALKKAPAESETVTEVTETPEEPQEIVIETPEESEPQEMSQDDLLNEVVETCISEMPLEDKVAGLFIVTPEQLTGVATAVKAGSGTQEALGNYAVGGIVYSAKNIKSEEQIKEMLQSTASMSKYPIFTAVFEEGASSSSVTSSIGIEGITQITDAESATNTAKTIGSALFQYGFNLDLAPNMGITEDSLYGTDVSAVRDITTSLVTGIQESGVSACAYAFPLKGDTSASMATSDATKDQLVVNEYEVFKGAIDNGGVNAIMVSNISLPQLTGDNTPASLSEKVIQEELRGTLGFGGIVITDSLSEGAVTEYYTPGEAAIAAVKSGADMLYLPQDFTQAYEGLLAEVKDGSISEERINESLRRIYRIKYSERIDQISN